MAHGLLVLILIPPCRLAGKEEECELAMEKLHHKDELLCAMEKEKTKWEREGSSRVANLNQALMQTKQFCAQVSEQNETLEHSKWELFEKYATLEQKYEALVAKGTGNAPCRSCHERQRQLTPIKTPSKPYATPRRPIPEETEVDVLQNENAKLKKEVQCIQTNFQVTAQRSAELKKEVKEMEKSLEELQVLLERTLEEKEVLQQKYKEVKVVLENKTGSVAHDRKKNVILEQEAAMLKSQLEALQQQNFDFQDRLKTEVARSLESQDVIEDLDLQVKTLKEVKSKGENDLSTAQARLQELQGELMSHHQSTSYHSELQRQTSDAISAYEHKVTLLSGEKEELMEKLTGATGTIDEMQSQFHSLEESNKSLQTKLAGLEAQNLHLRDQRRELSLSHTELELQDKLVSLSEKYDELSGQNKELEEAGTQSASHIHELTKANAKLRREANHHWELAKKLQKELEKQESCSLRVEECMQEKEQQHARMTREVEDLKLELSSVTGSKCMYEAEVGRLVNKLEELELSNFKLSTNLAEIEGETTTARASQSEAHFKLEELEATLGATHATLLEREMEVTELRNSNELMEKENGILLLQVNSLSEMVAARNVKIEALQSQLSNYELDIREIVVRIAELEATHGYCTEMKQELRREIDSLKELVESGASYRKEAENMILNLKLEMKQLQEYNSSLEAINDDLQEKIKSEIARNEDLMSTCHEKERSLSDLDEEIKLKSASLKAALDEVDFINKSSEDAQAALKTELESLEVKCSELQDTCEELSQEKSDKIFQISHLRREVQELQRLNSNMKTENESLANRYEQSREEVSTMKEDLFTAQRELNQTRVEIKHQHHRGEESERAYFVGQQELAQTTEQYDKLRESIMGLVEQAGAPGSENAAPSTPTKTKLKGILKNASTGQSVLKAVQNLKEKY